MAYCVVSRDNLAEPALISLLPAGGALVRDPSRRAPYDDMSSLDMLFFSGFIFSFFVFYGRLFVPVRRVGLHVLAV